MAVTTISRQPHAGNGSKVRDDAELGTVRLRRRKMHLRRIWRREYDEPPLFSNPRVAALLGASATAFAACTQIIAADKLAD